MTASVSQAAPQLRAGWTAGEQTQLPRKARKDLKAGIKLLKRGDMAEFLSRFIHPDDLAQLPPRKQLIAEFSTDKADAVRSAFEAALSDAPTWTVVGPNGEQSLVVEVRHIVADIPRDLLLQEHEGTWYVRN